MCELYCIAFTEYKIAGKTLLDYNNLFSPNDYKKNDKIIHKFFLSILRTNMSVEFRFKKNRWNNKLSFRGNETII